LILRAVSLALAGLASVIVLVFPFLLARRATGLNQSILLLMMAGIAGAFIYGAGFRPARKTLRIAIRPALTWALIIGSLAALAALR
jgi:predicted membrane protein